MYFYSGIRRERVYHRGTDAVKTACRFGVPITAKFTAGMKRCHHGLKRGHFCLLMNINGNTAAIVCNAHAILGQEYNLNMVGIATHSFITTVIKDLPNEVMETLKTGGADIHTRTLSHRFKTL